MRSLIEVPLSKFLYAFSFFLTRYDIDSFSLTIHLSLNSLHEIYSAKVCPVLKDSYKHLAVAKQDLKCAELVMEETKIEINKCEEQLQLAKEKFKLAKSRCETEENIVHRAAAYVAETELQVPCPWNQNFARLQKYNEEFGHIDLPSRCSEDKDLDTVCYANLS